MFLHVHRQSRFLGESSVALLAHVRLLASVDSGVDLQAAGLGKGSVAAIISALVLADLEPGFASGASCHLPPARTNRATLHTGVNGQM